MGAGHGKTLIYNYSIVYSNYFNAYLGNFEYLMIKINSDSFYFIAPIMP